MTRARGCAFVLIGSSRCLGLAAAISTCVFLYGCNIDGDGPSSEDVRVDIGAGGRKVVSNPDHGAYAADGGLRLVEDLRVGSGPTGNDSVAFGDVVSLAVDGDGAIYVADKRRGEILVFDTAGVLVRRIGRRGDGPGEFSYTLTLGASWQAPNRLWVGDGPLLQVVDQSGRPLASAVGVGQLAAVPKTDTMQFAYVRRSDADPDALMVPTSMKGTYAVVKYGISAEGKVVAMDSLRLGQWTRTSRILDNSDDGKARVVVLEALPMEPDLLWAVGPSGNAWIAPTSEYLLHEVTFAGDTIRSVELRREPVALGGAERDSLAEASGFGVRELPAFRPAMDRLDIARDGLAWVRNRLPDGTFAWDVFDACGRYLGDVVPEMRLDARPLAVGEGGRLLGVVKDDLDIEYVVRMSLLTPAGARVEALPC